MRIRFAADGHLLDHLNTIAFETHDLLRVIGEETKLTHAKIVQDLCADPLVAQVARETQFGIGLHGVESFLL